MSTTQNKKIAEELIALNTNIFLWNREHIEKSFNINGKTKEGELTVRQFHVLTFIKNGGMHTVSENFQLVQHQQKQYVHHDLQTGEKRISAQRAGI
jgi:hypothetical protein